MTTVHSTPLEAPFSGTETQGVATSDENSRGRRELPREFSLNYKSLWKLPPFNL